jgi:hypothetical protein
MEGLSSALIYVLIYIGIVLVWYLIKRLASRRRRQSSRAAEVPQPPGEEPPDLAGLDHATSMAWSPSRAAVESLGRAEVQAARPPSPQRRFAKQALLGTRRDVQNAVVIATIMGPCRALEPPGDAAAPTSRERVFRSASKATSPG